MRLRRRFTPTCDPKYVHRLYFGMGPRSASVASLQAVTKSGGSDPFESALRLFWRCSALDAPKSTDVVTGWDITHLSVSSTSVSPASSASRFRAETPEKSCSFQYRSLYLDATFDEEKRPLVPGPSEKSYLPLSSPPASMLYAIVW
jgi:hypothetical protein